MKGVNEPFFHRVPSVPLEVLHSRTNSEQVKLERSTKDGVVLYLASKDVPGGPRRTRSGTGVERAAKREPV